MSAVARRNRIGDLGRCHHYQLPQRECRSDADAQIWVISTAVSGSAQAIPNGNCDANTNWLRNDNFG